MRKQIAKSNTGGQVIRRIRTGQGGARCWFTQCYLEAPSMVPENGWWYGFKAVICVVPAAGTLPPTGSIGAVTSLWIKLGSGFCRAGGVEGVTLSGGEPFQQAAELRLLCE